MRCEFESHPGPKLCVLRDLKDIKMAPCFTDMPCRELSNSLMLAYMDSIMLGKYLKSYVHFELLKIYGSITLDMLYTKY